MVNYEIERLTTIMKYTCCISFGHYNKKTQAALVVTLFETPPNENKAPPSPKGMELHHLKKTQCKVMKD